MKTIGIVLAVAIVLVWGVVFYLRKVQGRSTDLKKRDKSGKIMR